MNDVSLDIYLGPLIRILYCLFLLCIEVLEFHILLYENEHVIV